ncbi:MAG: hypothetical protein ABI612_17840 [Betaproteobacteria bacterium]
MISKRTDISPVGQVPQAPASAASADSALIRSRLAQAFEGREIGAIEVSIIEAITAAWTESTK